MELCARPGAGLPMGGMEFQVTLIAISVYWIVKGSRG